MIIFSFSSVESCGFGHGISSGEEEVCPSSPKKERSMTMAIFLPSSVGSCGGGHGISSREEEVCSLLPKKKRRMTMATLLSSILDALQDQDPFAACRLRRRREKLGQGGHGLCHHLLDGHLLLFLSRELWIWSWHSFWRRGGLPF